MKSVLAFLIGAAVGATVAWFVSNDIYEKRLDETRKAYAESHDEAIKQKEEESNRNQYNDILSKESYNYSSVASIMSTDELAPVEIHEDTKPYLIAEARFEGDPKYAKRYLLYSVENDLLYEGDEAIFTVYDEKGDPVDMSVEDILGDEFMEEATDYSGDAADICHVRNESLQMDFEVEILR